MPPEEGLAVELGVSRTTVRKALAHLGNLGILASKDGFSIVIRTPHDGDYFPVEGKAITRAEEAENFILWKLSEKELRPDERFSELALARECRCNRTAVREALIKISQYRLIEKVPRQQWRVVDLDEDLVDELMQMRALLESFAVRRIVRLPDDNSVWGSLKLQLKLHCRYKRDRDPFATGYQAMDKGLHHIWLGACENRFIDDFFAVCGFLIDYQLRPRKLRSARIDQAIKEHIAILEALIERDESRADDALGRHMTTVHRLLVESIHLDK